MLACSVDYKGLGGNTTSASGSSVAFHLTIHQYPARCARPDVQTLAHAGSIPKPSRQTPLRPALQHSTILTPRGHHIAIRRPDTKDYRTAAYEMKLEGRKEGSSKVSAVACMLHAAWQSQPHFYAVQQHQSSFLRLQAIKQEKHRSVCMTLSRLLHVLTGRLCSQFYV